MPLDHISSGLFYRAYVVVVPGNIRLRGHKPGRRIGLRERFCDVLFEKSRSIPAPNCGHFAGGGNQHISRDREHIVIKGQPFETLRVVQVRPCYTVLCRCFQPLVPYSVEVDRHHRQPVAVLLDHFFHFRHRFVARSASHSPEIE